MANKHYRCVAVGGTFDHMHAGHISFLEAAFAAGDHVYIGVTTDNLVHPKRYRSSLEPYTSRIQALVNFLHSRNLYDRSTLIPLNDMYGIAGDEKNLDALVVTQETKKNGEAINLKRKKNGLAPLAILTTSLIAGDDQTVIRSTRIRQGEIDREGNVYRQLFPQNDILVMPEHLRTELRKPLGEIIVEVHNSPAQTAKKAIKYIEQQHPLIVISVGDVVTHTLKRAGMTPCVSIIDYITRRKQAVRFSDIPDITARIVNQAGTISPEAAQAVFHTVAMCKNEITCNHVIAIAGEEDLLTLPAILFAPLSTIVVYGQMGMGIVIVPVTEQIKERTSWLIRQFTKKKLQS